MFNFASTIGLKACKLLDAVGAYDLATDVCGYYGQHASAVGLILVFLTGGLIVASVSVASFK
jgi:hypothetical protein